MQTDTSHSTTTPPAYKAGAGALVALLGLHVLAHFCLGFQGTERRPGRMSWCLTGCMVPPAMTTARHSLTTWAKCTAGFKSKNLRLLSPTLPERQTDKRQREE
ncbi:hypothetical protein I79_025837 [Cricetulus griseus]|uniref:Uncharacterized protein n=1 Tax=Cricetulus griseus TaxID=10029 RepID=G3IPD1_CRIGR|nr:hypothetical protein I79_025837 [Cricetulus griseus]